DWDSTAVRVGTYAQLLVLAWMIWVLAVSDARVQGLLQSYVLGTCVCAIGTISNAMAGRTTSELGDIASLSPSGRYSISGLNPNDLGLMIAISIPMTLYLLARRKASPAVALLCWLELVLSATAIL